MEGREAYPSLRRRSPRAASAQHGGRDERFGGGEWYLSVLNMSWPLGSSMLAVRAGALACLETAGRTHRAKRSVHRLTKRENPEDEPKVGIVEQLTAENSTICMVLWVHTQIPK